MSDTPKIHEFDSLKKLVDRLRDDFVSGDQDFVMLYAYNGTGKTRISMKFKDVGKEKNNGDPDTLYYNAFTEDLFLWDNDLEEDEFRVLKLNAKSTFFDGLGEFEIENRVRDILDRYADFGFAIDMEYATPTDDESKPRLQKGRVTFSREVIIGKGKSAKSVRRENIKISRGEERIFVWCFFLAIIEIRLDKDTDSYDWAKFVYIDDPISSLDDNNAIKIACDLAQLLIEAKGKAKVIFSTHHALFFNVMCNELKKSGHKKYFLHRPNRGAVYTLRSTDDTPFFHHVAMLSEVKKASESGKLFTYHFNTLRSIMEKTASFFGHKDFSFCMKGIDDQPLYSRALNLMSHGKYSFFEPSEMVDDNKNLFRQILKAFLKKHQFHLPEILKEPATTTESA